MSQSSLGFDTNERRKQLQGMGHCSNPPTPTPLSHNPSGRRITTGYGMGSGLSPGQHNVVYILLLLLLLLLLLFWFVCFFSLAMASTKGTIRYKNDDVA